MLRVGRFLYRDGNTVAVGAPELGRVVWATATKSFTPWFCGGVVDWDSAESIPAKYVLDAKAKFQWQRCR